MSRPKGLGSPHIRGDSQPRREPPRWGRLPGCLAAPVFILFLVVIGVVVLAALIVGLYVIPGWIVGALPPTLLAGVMGLVFAVVFFGALIITAARPDRWHAASPARMLYFVVVWVLLGLMGVAMLVYALTRPPGGSGF